MLTPDQIKNKEFHTTGKGSYRSEEVDDFMKEVYSSYERRNYQKDEHPRK